MIQTFSKIYKVNGELFLPGDKSISHRAVIFSAMADGESIIENLSDGDDVNSTIYCLQRIGAKFKREENKLFVTGCGFKGFSKPESALDAGNSGTTARLLTGLLAAQDFESKVIGDESLSKRPMMRIIEPLKQMGAKIESSDGCLPIKIYPTRNLKPITYELPVPSAQVKSSVLIAGLHLDKKTCVIEKTSTRNHTEIMLNLETKKNNGDSYIFSSRTFYPVPDKYYIPSDISSASFFIVLALICKNSNLTIKNISLNNSRISIIEILKKMGANISVINVCKVNEPYGDLIIESSNLKNIEIPKTITSHIIDEIPTLTIAGIFAEGDFEIRNVKELRVKESDRIAAMVSNLKLIGLDVEEYEDGFKVSGAIKNPEQIFKSYNDHRIAMSFAILCALTGYGRVEKFECVRISNPNFLQQLRSIATI